MVSAIPRKPTARAAVFSGAVLGGVGIVGYAAAFPLRAMDQPSFLSVLFVGVMSALGAAAAGGVIGFLFGVPRTVSSDVNAEGSSGYVANTNLEQISDWLTKIFIGATLVQLGSAVDGLSRLFAALGPSFGGRNDSATFAGALLVYFSTLGFAVAWLSARLYLAAAFTEVDRLLREAAAAARAGQSERAAQLRQAALALTDAGQQYEALRSSPAGPERTWRMEALVSSMRAHAAKAQPPVSDARAMFARGGDGDRVAALAMMQGNLDAADVDIVRDVIAGSRSAFEQYHALVVAKQIAERDKNAKATADSQALAATIREALVGGRRELLRGDRNELAEEALALLEARKA